METFVKNKREKNVFASLFGNRSDTSSSSEEDDGGKGEEDDDMKLKKDLSKDEDNDEHRMVVSHRSIYGGREWDSL